MKAFGREAPPTAPSRKPPNLLDALSVTPSPADVSAATDLQAKSQTEATASPQKQLVEQLLNPVSKHTAIVKIQGPFEPRQLRSIAEGLVYLERLGLVSIIVVDDEDWSHAAHVGTEATQLRRQMTRAATELAQAIEAIGGRACTLVNNLFRLRDIDDMARSQAEKPAFNPLTSVESLRSLKAAISRGEMPIIPPIALDGNLAAVAVPANDAVKALVDSLLKDKHQDACSASIKCERLADIDLTPLRMMIINREGGIPSPARGGNPHLSINLESEYDYIHDTFIWQKTHPTSLDNMSLLQSCLQQLPRESSAVIVSHRSPKALIANLITNKPAHSPSLHHSLLPARHIQHMPTMLRRGLPIRVIRDLSQIDKPQLTALMEASFRRTLKADEFYERMKRDMDFVIVAGTEDTDRDYQAAAIVTHERDSDNPSAPPICYLDKFAVLPSLQGDGTVDFLWTALRDETFGLGLLDALNPNGGKEGVGFGTDLVWRSRANNPVNKWYFERSNGFVSLPEMGKGGVKGTMFWCDAEDRIMRQMESSDAGQNERKSLRMVLGEEEGRLKTWARIIGGIGSCWEPL